MYKDPKNNFREKLFSVPLAFDSRVNNPWESYPDLKTYNKKIGRIIQMSLRRMAMRSKGGKRVPSTGLLMLGSAGMGKTHLLMRAAHELGHENHIMFIRRPNDKDTVARHIWVNMIESLTRPIPSEQSGSQLDALLAHVFSKMLLIEVEKHVESGIDDAKLKPLIEDLKQDPKRLFHILENVPERTLSKSLLLEKLLNYLAENHPEVEQGIARALINYCFSESASHKRIILTWLKGQSLTAEEQETLSLPESWVQIDPEVSDRGIIRAKEEKALQAIASIGVLSTYHSPLILACDQLEGLRGHVEMTMQWGDRMREIFTMTPNLLVMTCIFPDLWEDWFKANLDEGAISRINEYRYDLSPFEYQHAREIVELHMQDAYETLDLPSSIYPFQEQDIKDCFEGCLTPRTFLIRVRRLLEEWLFEDEEDEEGEEGEEGETGPKGGGEKPPPIDIEPTFTREQKIESLLSDQLTKLTQQYKAVYAEGTPNEEELSGKLKDIFYRLLKGNQYFYLSKAVHSRVLPSNFTLLTQKYSSEIACIAVCNAHNNSLTSRIKNIKETCKRVLFVRDARCKKPGNKGQAYLHEVNRLGGLYLSLREDSFARLYAISEMFTKVIEQEYQLDDETHLNENEYVSFLLKCNDVANDRLFSTAFQWLQEEVEHWRPEEEPPPGEDTPPKEDPPLGEEPPLRKDPPLEEDPPLRKDPPLVVGPPPEEEPPLESSEEQKQLIAQIEEGGSFLVNGVVGSGKTLLMAHWMCSHLQKHREDWEEEDEEYNRNMKIRVYAITTTEAMCSQLKKLTHMVWKLYSQDDFPKQYIIFRDVWYLLDLLRVNHSLNRLGAEVEPEKSHDLDRVSAHYRSQIMVRGCRVTARCNVLLLDGAQDAGTETLALLRRFIKPDEEGHQRMILFQDFSQALYPYVPLEGAAIQRLNLAPLQPLTQSYRSTRPIQEFTYNTLLRLKKDHIELPEHLHLVQNGIVENVSEQENPWYRTYFTSRQGTLPTLQIFQNVDEEMQAIRNQLNQWLTVDKISPEDIVVIAPDRRILSSLLAKVVPALEELGVSFFDQRQGKTPEQSEHILLTTPHLFRGCEAKVVLLAGIESFANQEEAIFHRMLYVAMSRARSILRMFGSKRKNNINAQQLIFDIQESLRELRKHLENRQV